jgi:hypothetical protein
MLVSTNPWLAMVLVLWVSMCTVLARAKHEGADHNCAVMQRLLYMPHRMSSTLHSYIQAAYSTNKASCKCAALSCIVSLNASALCILCMCSLHALYACALRMCSLHVLYSCALCMCYLYVLSACALYMRTA